MPVNLLCMDDLDNGDDPVVNRAQTQPSGYSSEFHVLYRHLLLVNYQSCQKFQRFVS